VSSRTACSTKQVPGQPGPHGETLSQGKEKKKKKKSKQMNKKYVCISLQISHKITGVIVLQSGLRFLYFLYFYFIYPVV
jgi:hypothetical protein